MADDPQVHRPGDGKVYPEYDRRQINTSLQHGGPGCTVATWEELTGIPIDHFMMIDFAGVVSMADAVGGVPVCVDNNVYDPQSKLRPEAKGNSRRPGRAGPALAAHPARLRGRQRHRPGPRPAHVHELDGPPAQGGHQAHRPGQAERPGRGGHQGAHGRRRARHGQEALRPRQRPQAGPDQAHHHDHDALELQRPAASSCPSPATPTRPSRSYATTSRWTARTRRSPRPTSPRRPPSRPPAQVARSRYSC